MSSYQLKQLGTVVRAGVKKLNMLALIDEMEKDQELADKLEQINRETREQQQCKMLCHEAEQACLDTIRRHLVHFLKDHPSATYEQWIDALHPENTVRRTSPTSTPTSLVPTLSSSENQDPLGKKEEVKEEEFEHLHPYEIDHRFYVHDSDHRILWNEMLQSSQRQFVPPRTSFFFPSQSQSQSQSHSNEPSDLNSYV